MLIPSRGPHPFRPTVPGVGARGQPARSFPARQTGCVPEASAAAVRLRPAGPRAVLVEVEGHAQALALADWARRIGVAATEIVPGATTVLFDGLASDGAARLRLALDRWAPDAASPAARAVTVAVDYGGPDLDDVAGRWGTDPDGVVARHQAQEYVAAFCGFAPGFAYLAGLPTELAVPRLETPRSQVPAGSVGLADAWCGVYPSASPGGWRLIGRTDASLWEPGRSQPALLAPGTRVRFVTA